jgi:UDP-3-O-[3-hydroxymyristoyl] glucosamine N-acyltransferase
MARNLNEIVARFGGTLRGDGARTISGLGTLETATPEQISFLANPKYRSQLSATRAGAVILSAEAAEVCPVTAVAIITPQPYLYFARVSQWLADVPRPDLGTHLSAIVESPFPTAFQLDRMSGSVPASTSAKTR